MARILKITFVGLLLGGFMTAGHSYAETRFVALGDSYTAGTGASPEDAWPVVVTKQLQEKGIAISLVANLGQNGWSSKDLLQAQLPAAEGLNPDFVTLLIGTNDWVREVPAQDFKRNFVETLERLLVRLKPDRILVMTLPDFSVTPKGPFFAMGRDIAGGLGEFNVIISEEAARRGIKVVDLFSISQAAVTDVDLVSMDGLHPSAKGYALWSMHITPVIEELLKRP